MKTPIFIAFIMLTIPASSLAQGRQARDGTRGDSISPIEALKQDLIQRENKRQADLKRFQTMPRSKETPPFKDQDTLDDGRLIYFKGTGPRGEPQFYTEYSQQEPVDTALSSPCLKAE